MTTTTSPAPVGDRLPAAPLSGELLSVVAYAFSDTMTGSMSASVGAGDYLRHRSTLAGQLGVDAHTVAWMNQVHGSTVVDPDGHMTAEDMTAEPSGQPRCDAMVTALLDRPLAVLVADCVPVLLATTAGVGVAHSGREGTVRNVVGATVRRLRALPGHDNAGLNDAGLDDAVLAVVGPAIGGCCYEVPEALARKVEAIVPGTAGTTSWGTPSLDLVAGVTGQLRALGVRQVSRAGGCTRCEGDGRWFSHRASDKAEGRSPGRQAGMIVRRAVHQ